MNTPASPPTEGSATTPDPALIDSMAMRYRHDFGLLTEQQQENVRRCMYQLWEEVVGLGFYKLPAEPSDGAIYAAGSRPLPDEIMAEVQKRSLVQRVTSAYESGMGRGMSGRDLAQPYEPACHEGIAYETGWYQGRSRRSPEPRGGYVRSCTCSEPGGGEPNDTTDCLVHGTHKWEIEPHMESSDADILIVDDDDAARDHILAIAEHLWDQIEPGEERVLKIRRRPETKEGGL